MKNKIREGVLHQIGEQLYAVDARSRRMIMAKAPQRRRKRRKEQAGSVKQLSPAPLPRNSAGFGKCWIGDALYRVADDTVIPKAALDSMRHRSRR